MGLGNYKRIEFKNSGWTTAVIRVGKPEKAANLGFDLRALRSYGGCRARKGHSSQLSAGIVLWWVEWRKDGSRMGGQRSERWPRRGPGGRG